MVPFLPSFLPSLLERKFSARLHLGGEKVSLSKKKWEKKAQPLKLDGCGAVLDRAVPPRTLERILIGRGDSQRLYRERTNGRWGLMGVGSERGVAVLSRVELYGGGEQSVVVVVIAVEDTE